MTNLLVLHDINNLDIDKADYTVFKANQTIKPCNGCFGCWIKTPGKCVIKDSSSEFAATMPYVNEIIIISQLVFGGFSPNIKVVLDHSIGFILPFFNSVNGEMHHKQRYTKRPSFKYMFYGSPMVEDEKETAQKLIKANAINFGVDHYTIHFFNSPQEVWEELQ